METNSQNLYVYVLVRNDLNSLTPGKAASQVHHAGVQMASKHHSSELVQKYISAGQIEGADHFSTTITLSANMQEIETAMARIKNIVSCVYDIVIDPSYPFLVDPEMTSFLMSNKDVTYVSSTGTKDLFTRQELTVAWALGDKNDPVFRSAFENLELY